MGATPGRDSVVCQCELVRAELVSDQLVNDVAPRRVEGHTELRQHDARLARRLVVLVTARRDQRDQDVPRTDVLRTATVRLVVRLLEDLGETTRVAAVRLAEAGARAGVCKDGLLDLLGGQAEAAYDVLQRFVSRRHAEHALQQVLGADVVVAETLSALVRLTYGFDRRVTQLQLHNNPQVV